MVQYVDYIQSKFATRNVLPKGKWFLPADFKLFSTVDFKWLLLVDFK